MLTFSKTSSNRLAQCDERLQRVFNTVLARGRFDCSVLCGHRNEADQNEAYRTKKSTKSFPNSKHNTLPSKAIDVAPYPLNWENLDRFRFFVGYVLGIADEMGIRLRSGLDWDGDTDLDDQNLIDMPHFEVIG